MKMQGGALSIAPMSERFAKMCSTDGMIFESVNGVTQGSENKKPLTFVSG